MQINGNLSAANAGLRSASGAFEKLSSGLRINRAKDDAAGLAISEKMNAQIRGHYAAVRNASDSMSMIRVGEGALGETHSALQRMRELAIQSTNGIYTASDRNALQTEMKQLQAEIDRIGNTTEFNTQKLLDGSATGAAGAELDGQIMSQIGANSGQVAFTAIGDMRAGALGVGGLDISTAAGAVAAMEAIDTAIATVSSQRGQLGAMENRFEHTVNNLNNAAENQIAAQSRVRDADMAREVTRNATDNILRQTSLAMVAQANMSAQNVLRLLG